MGAVVVAAVALMLTPGKHPVAAARPGDGAKSAQFPARPAPPTPRSRQHLAIPHGVTKRQHDADRQPVFGANVNGAADAELQPS